LGLPAAAGIHNPIDVLGDAPPDRYLLALETAINDPGVDSLMVIVTPQAMTEGEKTAEVITKLAAHTEKPIVTVFTDGATLAPARLLLQKAGVATLTHAENAARALGNLTTVAHWQTLDNERAHSVSPFKKEAAKILKNTTPHANGYLTEEDTRKLLGLYGFIFPKTIVLTAEAEAHAASKEFSSPVVLKIISPDIIHKTDAGGVLLNVAPQDITLAYQTILANTKKNAPEAKMTGVLAAEMIPSTTPEILLGVKTESTLGKLVVAGLGGIYVEVFKDVAARFSPLTEQDAEEMLQELKAWPVLAGTRGQEGIPLKELEARILALSLLVADCPQISELDINPLVYNAQKGFVCLDARIRLEAS
jgi:acetyltransferase